MRYTVFSELSGQKETIAGETDDITQANKILLAALQAGAVYGHIIDDNPTANDAPRNFVRPRTTTMEP